jgi:hypothetical protein
MSFDLTMEREPPLSAYGDSSPPELDSPGSLALSVAGMNLLMQAMEHASLLDGIAEPPDFTEIWVVVGIPHERYVELKEREFGLEGFAEPSAQELLDIGRADAALRQAQSRTSPVAGKVPSYKFASADGWRITPAECAIIAEVLAQCNSHGSGIFRLFKRARPAKEAAIVQQWIEFNRVAAMYGGYTVG